MNSLLDLAVQRRVRGLWVTGGIAVVFALALLLIYFRITENTGRIWQFYQTVLAVQRLDTEVAFIKPALDKMERVEDQHHTDTLAVLGALQNQIQTLQDTRKAGFRPAALVPDGVAR